MLHFQDGAQGLVLKNLLRFGLAGRKLQVGSELEQLMFVAHGIFTKVPAKTTRCNNGFTVKKLHLCRVKIGSGFGSLQSHLLPLLQHPSESRLKIVRDFAVQNRFAHGGFDDTHLF